MGIFQSTLNDPHKNRLDGSRKVLLTVLALVIFLNYGKHKQKQINIGSDSVNLLLQRLYILHARHLISNIFIITTQTTHDIPTLC